MYGPIPLPPSQKNITNRKPFHTPRMDQHPLLSLETKNQASRFAISHPLLFQLSYSKVLSSSKEKGYNKIYSVSFRGMEGK
jgi:hypothetical protein